METAAEEEEKEEEISKYVFEIGLVIKKNIGDLAYYCRHIIFKVHDKVMISVATN